MQSAPGGAMKFLPSICLVLALWSALPASAQPKPCGPKNMAGTWKLIAEHSVTGGSQPAPVAEYLEVRSGQLFWVVQPVEGERTRERHKLFFAGSGLSVQPALAKAPVVTRCTRSGNRLVMLTAAFDDAGAQRKGRLEFRKLGG